MSKKLHVGCLNKKVSDGDLKKMFSRFGGVNKAKVSVDGETGKSKGFGYVEMDSHLGAGKAIAAMNDKEIDGHRFTVTPVQTPASKLHDDGQPNSYGDGYGGGFGGSYSGGRDHREE